MSASRGRPLLTAHEREILDRIAAGKTAPAIGQELFLSTATIKSHLGHLYEKLGVGDRAAAVAEAMRLGPTRGAGAAEPIAATKTARTTAPAHAAADPRAAMGWRLTVGSSRAPSPSSSGGRGHLALLPPT